MRFGCCFFELKLKPSRGMYLLSESGLIATAFCLFCLFARGGEGRGVWVCVWVYVNI